MIKRFISRKNFWLLAVLFVAFIPLKSYAVAGPAEDLAKSELSVAWKSMTSKEKKSWKDWAKANCIYVETDTECRIVGARKAFGAVMKNRFLAGDSLRATTTPIHVDWASQHSGALSIRDAGPFTENEGYVGFRADRELVDSTKWLVWATPPLDKSVALSQKKLKLVKQLQFLASFSIGPIGYDDIIPSLGSKYQKVIGPFDGPGSDGAWPDETHIWFRLQQYVDGQLGPAQILDGRIQVEL